MEKHNFITDIICPIIGVILGVIIYIWITSPFRNNKKP